MEINQSYRTEYRKQRKFYIPIKYKFMLTLVGVFIWGILSVYLAQPWMKDLAREFNWVLSILIISGVAIIPGCLNAFLVISLLLDRYVPFSEISPTDTVTILIAAYNEENGIYSTLEHIEKQEYEGHIKVVVINNNSSDDTVKEIMRAKKELKIEIDCIDEITPGKHHALNTALKDVGTEYVITLDADTILHHLAIKHLVARIKTAPVDTAAVAGSVLVRNSRENLMARMQEWDYFLSIASIKRMQGLYQGTLVAQGAFSVYRTEVVKDVGGWPDVIGEDIVLTWNILEKGYRVFYEPKSLAFTDVPTKLSHFAKQRARWARGMIEAIKAVKPWKQPSHFAKVSTGIDLVIPFIDFAYTFFWIPGFIMAVFFKKYYIVGPMALLVLPLTFLSFYILYRYQRYHIFDELGLRVRKNKRGLVCFLLTYQILMSPISLYGYVQEFFHMKRVWK